MKTVLHSKIHRAKVTETEKDYNGSITIGKNLLEASKIEEHEKVQVVNVDNGERLETYVIEGEKGEICLNGAAARKACKEDEVIIICYRTVDEDSRPEPRIVHVNSDNEVVEKA
ncbi:MAG: aspartate 1-decarboxylase [Candidatus Nanohalobium sp.]